MPPLSLLEVCAALRLGPLVWDLCCDPLSHIVSKEAVTDYQHSDASAQGDER